MSIAPAFAKIPASKIASPWPGAYADIDFVAQVYYFNGATRTTAEFTAFSLGGAVLGAQGLVCDAADTPDIRVPLVGTFLPGAMVASLYHTAVPVAGSAIAIQLDAGTTAERLGFQQTNTPNWRF